MATIKKEVKICDICGNETKDFIYWECRRNNFGMISESTLAIDICEHCAKEIKSNIPENMMLERYGSEIASKEEIENRIKEWQKIVLED